jgi:hypothetical protein
MSPNAIFSSLGCLIRGHAPIVEINESECKSECICERCGAVLGVFVVNLRKNWIASSLGLYSNGLHEVAARGTEASASGLTLD